MSYTVTDNRRTIEDLPVKSRVIASDYAQRPVAEVDSTIEVYKPEPVKEKEYSLDQIRLHFGEFLRHHAHAKEATDWTKQFKGLMPGVAGDASLMVMRDVPVATFRRDGKLAFKKLEAEQPQIVAKYTRMVTEPKFDEDAFKKDEPMLYQAYRARSFRLVNGGAGKGLVLPS